jgi:hypothetical protein
VKKRTKPQKLPGVSLYESARLLHATGKINDIERPNMYVCMLLLEARGILRAMKRRAKSRKATFDHMIDALENLDATLTELREGGVS